MRSSVERWNGALEFKYRRASHRLPLKHSIFNFPLHVLVGEVVETLRGGKSIRRRHLRVGCPLSCLHVVLFKYMGEGIRRWWTGCLKTVNETQQASFFQSFQISCDKTHGRVMFFKNRISNWSVKAVFKKDDGDSDQKGFQQTTMPRTVCEMLGDVRWSSLYRRGHEVVLTRVPLGESCFWWQNHLRLWSYNLQTHMVTSVIIPPGCNLFTSREIGCCISPAHLPYMKYHVWCF